MTGAESGDEVSQALLSDIRAGSMPGAAWWIETAGGRVSSGAVGWATLEPSREPTTPGTPYDLASLTKPLVTAALCALLEEEGRLDPAAPAAELLPELRSSEYARVTVEDLGTHRAGLPAWRPLYLEASDDEGFVRAIARTEPGTLRGTTLYSDLGYLLLGTALRRLTGAGLDVLFERRIREPLGPGRIGFPGPGSTFDDAAATENGNRYERDLAGPAGRSFSWRERIARGEVHDGNAHALGGVAGHAGIFGTAEAVAALGRAMMRTDSPLWSERSRRRLFDPGGTSGGRSFGFVLARDSEAARDVLPDVAPGHTGFTGTSLWLDPDGGRVFVLLTNRVHPTVAKASFQPVRRRFHEIANRICRS